MDHVIEQAKDDERALEQLIIANTEFILKVASGVTRTYIDKSSDEWSIGLMAFTEAIYAYSKDKGNFHAFAGLVIKRRVTDLLRKGNKGRSEISVSPSVFNGSYDDSDDIDKSLQSDILKKISYRVNDDIKYEIEAMGQTLSRYGFDFMELSDCSPKAQKTKQACGKAVAIILSNPELVSSIRKNKTLPIKTLEKNFKVHRKILERHRKYIITVVEIMLGDYPYLMEYVKFIKEYID